MDGKGDEMFVDKNCKLIEASNFTKIPKLSLKVGKASVFITCSLVTLWCYSVIRRCVNIV